MIIHCPSCSSDKAKVIGVKETETYTSGVGYTKYKSIKAVCNPCSKPLSDSNETRFNVVVENAKL